MKHEDGAIHAKYKVLLGITGCIAAYKSCEILRILQKRGCDVQVVMTGSATKFVGETTFHALSGHAVGTGIFGDPSEPIPHIAYAQDCDLFLIAPCTADTIAKIAHGIADNLLTSCALACTSPILIAPAMNVHMYQNPATESNIETLCKRGVHVMGTGYGRLACGDVGEGKLAPVEDIADAAIAIMEESSPIGSTGAHAGILHGVNMLITSGPTVEPIDPVRYISNRSSGKMGAALARRAIEMGASVTIVSGPVSVDYPHEADVIDVGTADEMFSAVKELAPEQDVMVFAAAVSDFKPKRFCSDKIKKSDNRDSLASIEMTENVDILATIAKDSLPRQVIVGFAAETNDILSNGRSKLASKGADVIVCNEVGDGKGFGSEGNSGWIITASSEEELAYMPKDDMAKIILERVAALLG